MDTRHRRIPLVVLALLAGQAAAMTPTAWPPEPTAAMLLMERAECPADMFQCPTSLGAVFSDVCCSNGQSCALDSNNSPACCPSGVVCTGVAPTGSNNPAPTQEASYVPNSYFSFPYAMTSFDDAAGCRSAISACSENFDICTSHLGGGGDGGGGDGGFGVTIDVPGGGGVTVEATATDLGISATSVCSSLSSEACSPLAATDCDSFNDQDNAGPAFSVPSAALRVPLALVLAMALICR